MTRAILYGATGYSGSRIARMATALGLRPTLAGRNAQALQTLAEELQLPWLQCDLSDQNAFRKAIAPFDVLLNCAGPFTATYRTVVEACIVNHTDYLDITGEVDVYEGLADYSDQARASDVMILPGAGFDMVPGDCLALWLKEQLSDATDLSIAYSIRGTISRGTLMSMPSGDTILARRNHLLVPIQSPQGKHFRFDGAVEVECYPLSFGDLSLAWRATGIPNITSYIHLTPEFQNLAALAAEGNIAAIPVGPDDEELQSGAAFVTGEASNPEGRSVSATITLPQIYQATFISAAHILQRVLAGERLAGYTTPAQLLGANFAVALPGFTLHAHSATG